MHSGSGNTGSTTMRTYGSKVEMISLHMEYGEMEMLSFFQCEDGMLNKARHESWLGQDIGG